MIFNSEQALLFIDFLYVVDNYFTFNIKAASGEFRGASNFCVSRENLILAIKTLSKMHQELTGNYVINDYDTNAFLDFKIDRLGHLSISGQIGGTHQNHYMKFSYTSDQTILMNLIKTFERLL